MPGDTPDQPRDREESINRYLVQWIEAHTTGIEDYPIPPVGLSEDELIRAIARRSGISAQEVRRRYQENRANDPSFAYELFWGMSGGKPTHGSRGKGQVRLGPPF